MMNVPSTLGNMQRQGKDVQSPNVDTAAVVGDVVCANSHCRLLSRRELICFCSSIRKETLESYDF